MIHLDRGHVNLHQDIRDGVESSLICKVCRNMAKHTFTSCNLAGFTWHVSTMLNELIHSCISITAASSYATATGASASASTTSSDRAAVPPPPPPPQVINASLKIALVGKARVVCGAMNLYRIMIHEALVKSCQNGSECNTADIFLFQSRQHDASSSSSSSSQPSDMALGLISSLLSFLCASVESKEMRQLVYSTPELYDATVLCLNLIMVLCSTQLYQPIISSFQKMENETTEATATTTAGAATATATGNLFLDLIMREASRRQGDHRNKKRDASRSTWSAQGVLTACLFWMVNRPPPPERSIAHHYKEMALMVVQDVKNEKPGLDGMYENYAIVMANAPSHAKNRGGGGDHGDHSKKAEDAPKEYRSAPKLLLDATKSIYASLLLLPIRLVVIALRSLGQSTNLLSGGKGSGDDAKLAQLQALYGYGNHGGAAATSVPSPTNDVLWLSDSHVADLGSSLFLLLANNHRAGVLLDESTDDYVNNPFRVELASMDDNRWEGYNHSLAAEDGYLGEATDVFESVDLSNDAKKNGAVHHYRDAKQNNLLTTNFEHLFDSFGGTLYNEVGALALYTLLQASPIFAASLAVRSDLDKLVIPLLRTLYFSSSISHHISGRTTTSSGDGSGVNVSQPFRSRSQLYLIMILLLIFSQDASFGPDSFRRSNIPNVLWYKERQLKDVSLGSLLVLSLLRCITFNLNRMQDPFLLSNCCAVLLNLSPHIVEMHSYAAMRLVSVLISTMKRYTVLVMKNGGKPAEEGDVSSMLGMYAEACRILLQVVKHSVRRKVVEKNLHLVYALVYHQRDFNTILKAKCKFVILYAVPYIEYSMYC